MCFLCASQSFKTASDSLPRTVSLTLSLSVSLCVSLSMSLPVCLSPLPLSVSLSLAHSLCPLPPFFLFAFLFRVLCSSFKRPAGLFTSPSLSSPECYKTLVNRRKLVFLCAKPGTFASIDLCLSCPRTDVLSDVLLRALPLIQEYIERSMAPANTEQEYLGSVMLHNPAVVDAERWNILFVCQTRVMGPGLKTSTACFVLHGSSFSTPSRLFHAACRHRPVVIVLRVDCL